MILRVDNSGMFLTDAFCNAVCDGGGVIHHLNRWNSVADVRVNGTVTQLMT